MHNITVLISLLRERRRRALVGWTIALLVGLMAWPFSVSADEGKPITLYSYHTYPPFVFKDGSGLSRDLVEVLNRERKGRSRFELRLLSRSTLDQLMRQPDFRGGVLWTSPLWFKPPSGGTSVWSAPLLQDAHVVLSSRQRPLDFRASDSIIGMSFGAIRGQYYIGIDELVAEDKIRRQDFDNERAALLALAEGRVDAIALPQSAAAFLGVELGVSEKIYIAPTPQNHYLRHIFWRNVSPEIQAGAAKSIAQIHLDSRWQSGLANYRVSDAAQARRMPIKLCFNNYPPYSMGDESKSSEPTGIKVDIAREVFAELKQPITIVTLPFKRCLREIELGNMDGALPLSKNEERAKYMAFSAAANPQSAVFVYRKSVFPNGVRWQRFEDLAQRRLLLNQGSIIDPSMEAAFTTVAPIARANDIESMLRMIDAERADLAATDKLVAQHSIVRLGLSDSLAVSEQTINNAPAYFGISKQSPAIALLPKINRILDRMNRDGTMDRIIQQSIDR